MSTPLTFYVKGLPTPQGSKSAWVNPKTGRAVIIDGGSTDTQRKHKAWRKAVHVAAGAALAEDPLWSPNDPVKVSLAFRLPAYSDGLRTLHATRPDLDKLVRSVLDSLTSGGLLTDDGRVAEVHAVKRYADEEDSETGCLVILRSLAAEEAAYRAERKRLRRRGSLPSRRESGIVPEQ